MASLIGSDNFHEDCQVSFQSRVYQGKQTFTHLPCTSGRTCSEITINWSLNMAEEEGPLLAI